MSEVFDPEKIERPYVKEWGHHAVYPADYDKLLALYRHACALDTPEGQYIKSL